MDKRKNERRANERRAAPGWQAMIDHIDTTWRSTRVDPEYGYPFTGKDMADLRHLVRTFETYGIMSLWDIYLATADDYVKKHAYSIYNFTRAMPKLMEKVWKPGREAYRLKHEPKEAADTRSKLTDMLGGLFKNNA